MTSLETIALLLGDISREGVRYIEANAFRRLRKTKVAREFDEPDSPDPWFAPGCRRVPPEDPHN